MANLSENKRYHYIYKTTNLINGKHYIGMHSTNNLEDDYLGSGKYLWRSIRKHGKENFKKEILEYCETREELARREKEIVTEESIKEIYCMNLKPGGKGGWNNEEHQKKCAVAGKENFLKKLKNDPGFKKKYSEVCSKRNSTYKMGFNSNSKTRFKKKSEMTLEELERFLAVSKKAAKNRKPSRLFGKENASFGTKWMNNGVLVKKVSKEDIKKHLSEGWIFGKVFLKDRRIKTKQLGAENSSYGTFWVTNGVEDLKVKDKNQLNLYLELGWQRGRKKKNISSLKLIVQ